MGYTNWCDSSPLSVVIDVWGNPHLDVNVSQQAADRKISSYLGWEPAILITFVFLDAGADEDTSFLRVFECGLDFEFQEDCSS